MDGRSGLTRLQRHGLGEGKTVCGVLAGFRRRHQGVNWLEIRKFDLTEIS